MLMGFTEPSSRQRIVFSWIQKCWLVFQKGGIRRCPCHLPIGQLLTPEKQNTEKIHEKMWCLKFRVRFMPPPFRISIEEFKSCVHLVVSANIPAPSYSTATCKARFHLILFRPVLRGRQTKIQKKKQVKMAAWHPSRQQFFPGLLQVSQLRLCRAMENAVRLLPISSLFWDPWNSNHLLVDTCWSTL